MPNQGKRPAIITRQMITDVKEYRKHHTQKETAIRFEIGAGSVSNIMRNQVIPAEDKIAMPSKPKGHEIEQEYATDRGSLTVRSLDVKTLDEALAVGKVDLSTWEVDRYIINSWETTAKDEDDTLQTYTNWQVKVWLKRKAPIVQSLDTLLGEIKKYGPICTPKYKPAKVQKHVRELEIALMDPHLGLHCFKPGADHYWDIETCKNMVLTMLHNLIEAAETYGPFSRIILPIGNDLLHSDNVFNTTTQGTPQPESESWQEVYVQAEKLCIQEVEICKAVAPVKVLSIMGNHDRQSVFTLGRLLAAYYHNDKTVEVDDTSSPYKFHHFGVNLIGFEHGHSIRQTVRLAALMANENKLSWSSTTFREWHLGDQHRKGSARTTMFEEQGCSVEYLPGLTPPDEWSRLKSFNWQKRAGVAFVWDKTAGPIARLQVNVDSDVGTIMR